MIYYVEVKSEEKIIFWKSDFLLYVQVCYPLHHPNQELTIYNVKVKSEEKILFWKPDFFFYIQAC